MSRVTIKQVIDFYDTHREYFANYITKDIHADLVMNSEFTPAELLDKWNATISRGHHIGLHEAKFKQYYPNVDYSKRHEIGQQNIPVDGETESSTESEVEVEKPQVPAQVPAKVPVDKSAEESFEVKNKRAVSKIIREIDLHNKTAFFKFARGSKSKFKELKPEIIDMINRFKPASDLFVKVYYKVDGQFIPKPTTFSLGNNNGMQKMQMLLDGKTYELIENVYDPNGQNKEIMIEWSETNKDNPYALSIDMVTGIEILHKNNLFRKGDDNCVKIYCDNGGSFYNYKISDEFINCKPL